MDNKLYKTRLLERQQSLMAISDISQDNSQVVELDQSKVGRLSRMDALQGQAMSLETKRRREEELARIKSALQRIEDDEFGICLECDEFINEKRLEIDPSVYLCIECAEKKEKI